MKALLCFFGGVILGITFIMLIATTYWYFASDIEIIYREAAMIAFNQLGVFAGAVFVGIFTGLIAVRSYEESKYN